MPKQLRATTRSTALAQVVAATFFVAFTALSPAAWGKGHGRGQRDLGPGCATDRPAIAHRAGGAVERHREKAQKTLVPCATKTGFRTMEISLAITNAGTVLFQPALATQATGLPIGLLRSTDEGAASWTFIDPAGQPPRVSAFDMNFWVDRDTGRIFWSGPNSRVDRSDTDGKTWIASSPVPMAFDHPQIFTGPPTKQLRHLLKGYPNVVYIVVAGGGTCGAQHVCGALISKSLDGGQTWSASVPLRYPAECPFPGNDPVGGYGLNGLVGRDGTIYVPFTPCQRPYVAISHDQGDTWQLSLVNDTQAIGWGNVGLGMDPHGNLYAAWTRDSDRLPYLAISRDNGLHWSAPVMVGAPGVNEAAEIALVAGATGQVAVTYYGSKNAPGVPFPLDCLLGTIGAPAPSIYSLETPSLGCPAYRNQTWSTYVTESFNALDRDPLFWSATLNDPAQPTWYGLTPSAFRVPGKPFPVGSNALAGFAGPTGSGHVDYYAMTISPDGTPWVGFFQECPFGMPVAGNPNCPSNLTGSPNDGLFGLVGRLVDVRSGSTDQDDDDEE